MSEVKREKWFSRHAIVFTRFLEITDRKEGGKCYSNSRSLECFEKDLNDICYQESEIKMPVDQQMRLSQLYGRNTQLND